MPHTAPTVAPDPNALNLARVMIRERDGTILYWSDGLAHLYGFDASRAVGCRAHELLHTVFPEPQEDIARAIDKAGEWSGEIVNRRNDGTTVGIATHCARYARERAPEVIVETNTSMEQHNLDLIYYTAIARSTDDAIIGTTLDGIVTSWNKAAESMFLFPAGEMVGKPVDKLLPPDRRREEKIILSELAQGKRINQYETLRLRKDGTEIAVSLTVSPIYGADGAIIGASKIARNITERRNMEERFQQMQSELAHMGRLSEMGQMASALAHELNQPLTATSNYIATARRHVQAGASPNACVIEALDKAGDQILRAGEVIRRLRGFLTKSGPEWHSERIERLIEDTAPLANIDAKFRDVSIRFDFGAPDACALLDRVQFQQVLLNLLRNAYEATEGCKSREVVISTRIEGREICIAIRDSGPGLPPELERTLFEPFVTSKRSGMGVGLWICRSIIRGFGGRIWYARAPAGGAQFVFTLPLLAD